MYLKIDNIKYHVQIKGEGKPLVCLHGFSENLITWEKINMPEYKMILIDIVGHGKSDKPFSNKYYNIYYIVKHLNMLFNKLELDRYSLLGYSMGGRICLAYAIKYPNKINKLILESTSYGVCGFINRYKRRKKDKELARLIKLNGIKWFSNYWSNLCIFDSQKNLSKEIIDDINKRRLYNEVHALCNTLLKSGQGSYPCYKYKVSQLKMPILYITGEYDKKYVQIGKDFRKYNSNIDQIILKGVGHNTHIEDPHTFNNIINNFIN